MLSIKNELGVPVGYSDHTEGIEVSIAAAAMGAEIIEKHFTLDKTMEGPDHRASLEPDELKAMVSAIRNVEKALGSNEKIGTPSERSNMNVVRKSIVASRKIEKGEMLSETNITTKRPGTGISPMLWHCVAGTQAVRDFQEDELIEI
jgi:N,N'-diacetyllegionaminate synthase